MKKTDKERTMLLLENINKTFNIGDLSSIAIYDNLNLKVEKGEFVVILGANGSGKSTLMNIISGDILVDAGEITLSNHKITTQRKHKRMLSISRVYQDPTAGTIANLTVAENLALAINKGKLFNFKLIDKGIIKNHMTLIDGLGMNLGEKLDVKIGSLSGGQRQAISLLMALMNKPDLLLLDEHTAALDPSSSEKIMALTNTLVSENKITTLMVTHNLKHAIDVGTRLIVFEKGKIIYDISGEAKQKLTLDQLEGMVK